jgi:diguanylate cyclase (GGDEF)-like protein
MLMSVHAFLSCQSRFHVAVGALTLIVAIGAADHLTGFELSLSIFYLLPVAVCAWYAGTWLGIAACIVSAAVWLLVDFTSGHPYSHPVIPYWNAGVRLSFFAIVAFLLVRLREALALQESLAQHDGLTGVLNARSFRQNYGLHMPLARRHRHGIALGYIDLDGFKSINDSLGHGAGDRLLKSVAAELASRLRASDAVARLGGDEFAVLLAESDLEGARALFADMRERLIAMAARAGWPVGFSIGVAVFHSPPDTAEDAIKLADALMYRVKAAGKNGLLLEAVAGDSARALPPAPPKEQK